MNSIRKIAAALALYSLATGAALAQTDWTGFYVGANLGQANGDSNVSTTPLYSETGYFASSSIPAITAASLGTVKPSGTTGGLTLGFNQHSGSVVYGIEADFNALSADDSRTDGAVYPCCSPTDFTITEQTKVSNLMTVRGRLGYATNNSLFYVTAGWAQAKIEINDEFTDTFASAHESFNDSKTQGDWIYGVGYEYGFNDNWSMKLEYLYADFGEVSGTSANLTAFSPAISFPQNVFTHTADLQMDVLRIGVNYRF